MGNESTYEIIQDSCTYLEDPDWMIDTLFSKIKSPFQVIYLRINYKIQYLDNSIDYMANKYDGNNNFVSKFIEKIKDIPDINNFKLIGDKTFQMGHTELFFEIHCRYESNGDEYELDILLNDVTRTMTIERTNAELKYKTLFLSKVAHEFRNPLISIAELINQSAEILDNFNEKNDSLHSNIALIKSLSDYLLVLTKDLNYFNETQVNQKGISINRKETNLLEVVEFCTNITKILLIKSNKAVGIKFTVDMEENKCEMILSDGGLNKY